MASMPHFVLLYHDCPPHYTRPSHWDLMLEEGDVLRTWALERLPREWRQAHARTANAHPNCPAAAEGNDVAAEQLGDHRRDYLEYEGEVSGDRGWVRRVAAGTYTSAAESPAGWQLSLVGDIVSGIVVLRRMPLSDVHWTLSCAPAS
jgi:hypothetical protein